MGKRRKGRRHALASGHWDGVRVFGFRWQAKLTIRTPSPEFRNTRDLQAMRILPRIEAMAEKAGLPESQLTDRSWMEPTSWTWVSSLPTGDSHSCRGVSRTGVRVGTAGQREQVSISEGRDARITWLRR
jgi:hypothetical protein